MDHPVAGWSTSIANMQSIMDSLPRRYGVQSNHVENCSVVRRLRLACCAVVVAVGLLVVPGTAAAQLTLAVQGDHFTVNGQPRFLAFISYFDALDATDNVSDFQYLRSQG